MIEKTLAQSAADARRMLHGFRAFEEVAAALDKAATAEQRLAESTVARDRMIEERDKLQAELPPLAQAIQSATAKRDALLIEVPELEKRASAAREFITQLRTRSNA